jgi:hypothetical protein
MLDGKRGDEIGTLLTGVWRSHACLPRGPTAMDYFFWTTSSGLELFCKVSRMHLTRQEPVYWLRRMGSDMLSGLPALHHMPKRKACPQPIRIEV